MFFAWPQWKKNLAALWFAQFSGMGAITGVLAFLPLYVEQLGISDPAAQEWWAGLLLGIAPLFAAISGPHWGAYADRKGRKLMLERVTVAFFLVMLAMAYASSVYEMLVLRALQGVFGGFTAAVLALVTSITPKEHIDFTMSVYQTAMIAGAAFGPLFGGFIADTLGYSESFMSFAALSILSLIIIHLGVQEDFQPQSTANRPSIGKQIRTMVAIPGLRAMLVIMFLIQFAIQVISPILPLYVQRLAVDPAYVASAVGAVVAAAALASAISSAAMGRLSQYWRYEATLLIASILSAFSCALQGLAGSVLSLGLARALGGLFMGAMLPTVNALAYQLIPPDQRGLAFGVTSSAALVGNMIGPVAGGFLAITLGSRSVFWATALLFLLLTGWIYVQRNKLRQKS